MINNTSILTIKRGIYTCFSQDFTLNINIISFNKKIKLNNLKTCYRALYR